MINTGGYLPELVDSKNRLKQIKQMPNNTPEEKDKLLKSQKLKERQQIIETTDLRFKNLFANRDSVTTAKSVLNEEDIKNSRSYGLFTKCEQRFEICNLDGR